MPTNLRVSKVEARNLIDAQLTKGHQLRDVDIFSDTAIAQARQERRNWLRYTTDLLERLFDSLEPRNEFQAATSPVVFLGNSLEQKARDFRVKMDNTIAHLQSLYERIDIMDEPGGDLVTTGPVNQAVSGHNGSLVFLVYGRNQQAHDAMTQFLQALGLHPLSWEEAVRLTGNAYPTNLQIVQAGMNAAQAILILMTGDEDAGLREKYRRNESDQLVRRQPRPNVLLEIGMAIAISPTRTIVAHFEDIETPSDIVGQNYVTINNRPDRRHALRSRLEGAGCSVSNSEYYLNPSVAGDFDESVRDII